MAGLADKRLFLLDMDGTLYVDDALFPGTLPFLHHVRAASWARKLSVPNT